MPKVNFPPESSEPPFFADIREEGYHILSLENQKIPGYYPKELPMYPGVSLKDLEIGDVITIRAFVKVGKGENFRVDGGLISLQVEFIDSDRALAVITTELPKDFPLETGGSVEIFEEEILYKTDV
jgi:hypothetical protein